MQTCARGDVDFILGALRENDAASGLKNERLMSSDMALLVRRDHPLAHARDLSIMDLRDAQWILPRSNAPALGLFEKQFRRMKVKPPVPTVETADLAVIRGLLFDTDMIAALSAHQLQLEIQSGQLAILDVKLHNTRRDIGLTMRSTGSPSPAAASIDRCDPRVRCRRDAHTQWLKSGNSAGVFDMAKVIRQFRKTWKFARCIADFQGEDLARTVRGETERLADSVEHSPGNQRVIDQILFGVAGTTAVSTKAVVIAVCGKPILVGCRTRGWSELLRTHVEISCGCS